MAKTGATGIKRIINAAGYSYKGIVNSFKNEAAFRQEVLACMALAPVAVYIGETIPDKLLLISALLFVLIVELINTGIEAAIDRMGDEYHELSGHAKDVGSAAVLLAIFVCIAVWIAILY